MKSYCRFMRMTGLALGAESHLVAIGTNNETAEKLSVFHTQSTGEQVLRQANGLGKWADEGTSILLECHDAEFVGLKMCVDRNFIAGCAGLVALRASLARKSPANQYRGR